MPPDAGPPGEAIPGVESLTGSASRGTEEVRRLATAACREVSEDEPIGASLLRLALELEDADEFAPSGSGKAK